MPAYQVILASANDPQGSLVQLNREMDTIYAFLSRMDKNLVEVHDFRGVTVEKLFEVFAVRKDRISIFHFSGHAGDLNLYFNDLQKVNGRGLAQLMGLAKNLDLVFLNGCATEDHIKLLHSAGTKRVIATSRPVFDDIAAEFSIQYYSFLTQYSTIGESFDAALAFLASLATVAVPLGKDTRHIDTTGVKKDKTGGFPYGIFYKKEQDESDAYYEKLEDWKFEDEADTPADDEDRYEPCVEFVKAIGEKGLALVQFLQENVPPQPDPKEIKQFVDLYNDYNEFKDKHDIYAADALSGRIMSLLPQPLAELVRQMASTAKTIKRKGPKSYNELIKYQFRFYDLLLRVSCFTTLSDLFEILQKKLTRIEELKTLQENETITPEELKELKDLAGGLVFDDSIKNPIMRMLALKESETAHFNYRDLIHKLRKTIFDNKSTPFVNEYNTASLGVADNSLDISHNIITLKKKLFLAGKLRGQLSTHCRAIEMELCSVMQEVYFILRYNVLIIRNIEAIKLRFKCERMCQHSVVLLRIGSVAAFELLELDSPKDYTEVYSVILVKGAGNILNYLSLSPFVIDKCVLTLEEQSYSDLYFFSHVDNDRVIFECVGDASSRIEIELRTRNVLVRLDEAGTPITKLEEYIPYVDKLAMLDPKLDKTKVTARLRIILEQFRFFKFQLDTIQKRIILNHERDYGHNEPTA